MEFFKTNWRTLIIRLLFNLVLFYLLSFLVYYYNITHNTKFSIFGLFITPLVLAILSAILQYLKKLAIFWIGIKIYSDNGDTGIKDLYKDGYEVIYTPQPIIEYKLKSMHGKINNTDCTIGYDINYRNMINIEVLIIDQFGKIHKSFTSIPAHTTFKFKLDRDIKPQILDFIKSIKPNTV